MQIFSQYSIQYPANIKIIMRLTAALVDNIAHT